MRLEQLHYLVELTKFKSINIAAKHLYVSHQAISKAIHKLEKEFGVPLLNRSPKGISLTQTGKDVVKIVQEVLTKLEELEKLKLDQNRESLKGNLSIYSVPVINHIIFPEVLTAFCKTHQHVNINTIVKSTSEIINDIKNGKADIGLISILLEDNQEIKEVCSSEEIISKKLFTDEIILCVKKTSPLANRKAISINELLKQPFVIYQPTYSLVINYLKKYGNPNIIINTNSMEIYKKSIIEGLGAGFISSLSLNKELYFKKEEISTLFIRDNTKIAVIMILPKYQSLSPVTNEFVRLLNTYYEK